MRMRSRGVDSCKVPRSLAAADEELVVTKIIRALAEQVPRPRVAPEAEAPALPSQSPRSTESVDVPSLIREFHGLSEESASS